MVIVPQLLVHLTWVPAMSTPLPSTTLWMINKTNSCEFWLRSTISFLSSVHPDFYLAGWVRAGDYQLGFSIRVANTNFLSQSKKMKSNFGLQKMPKMSAFDQFSMRIYRRDLWYFATLLSMWNSSSSVFREFQSVFLWLAIYWITAQHLQHLRIIVNEFWL